MRACASHPHLNDTTTGKIRQQVRWSNPVMDVGFTLNTAGSDRGTEQTEGFRSAGVVHILSRAVATVEVSRRDRRVQNVAAEPEL